MKQKRLLCAILALVLLCAAPLPVLAAQISNKRDTVLSATPRMPTIKVTVPTRGSVYINPLNLPVSIGNLDSSASIISTPHTLANYSDAPVRVDVTVTGNVKSGSTMTLASEPTGGVGTEKSAFIYFEMKVSNYSDVAYMKWDSAYDADKHIALVDGVPQTKTGMVTLAAKNIDGTVASGGYAPFRLTGDCVKKPLTSWTSKDGINVVVAFTFTPLLYA